MLFNSFEFLIFLPVVFAIYWLCRRQLMTNNVVILAASYVFYGWWSWRFLALIILTTMLSYASGLLIDRYRGKARIVCGANIAVNIGILAYFKYCNFFIANLRALLSRIGYEPDWFTVDVLLPVGISFYTFQALSYTIDVYRRDTEPTRDPVAFAAFIAFFPQLVAGPIERSTRLLPQFLRRRTFDYGQAVDGMRQILWGFFKKLVIADNCAILANNIFGQNPGEVNSSLLLAGAFFFTFQIYGDFSGYSDIAVGTAKLFGIRLMRNFDLPYFARDIAEFWRRWHISLTTWLIDYIYIPLGGSRKGRARTVANIMTVFLLSGLWHGAAWTFVVWGLYNGLLIVAARLIGIHHTDAALTAPGRRLPSLRDAGAMLVTFVTVMVGMVIFRSDGLTDAWAYLCGLCTPTLFGAPGFGAAAIASFNWIPVTGFILILQTVEWSMRYRAFGLDIAFVRSRAVRWAIYLSIVLAMAIFAGRQAEFIYFQF